MTQIQNLKHLCDIGEKERGLKAQINTGINPNNNPHSFWSLNIGF